MNYAIVLAGGIGARFGDGSTPKQYIELNGMPLMMYSLKTAEFNHNIDAVCVVAAKQYWDLISEWIKEFKISKVIGFAEAGKYRYDSVYNGVQKIDGNKKDTVMIMTSVCPLLSQRMEQHYQMIDIYDGVVTVIKATDAITYSSDGRFANRTLQKGKLFVQQGPQTYKYNILRDAHESYRKDEDRVEVFEDSELALNMGADIGMVMGDRYCIKVTYPEDLAIAQALLPMFMSQETQLLLR